MTTRRFRNVCLILAVLLVGALGPMIRLPQLSEAATVKTPDFYTTGNNAEERTRIPITTGTPYKSRIVYSIEITKGVKVGDLIDVTVDMEATNPHRYNAMYATTVVLAQRPDALTGQIISRPSGHNITPASHHGKDVRMGRITSKLSGRVYVNYVAWSASTRAASKDMMTIEKNYGTMTVTNWGPVS